MTTATATKAWATRRDNDTIGDRAILREAHRLLADLHERYYATPAAKEPATDLTLNGPEAAAHLLADMGTLNQEQLRVILLNTRNRVIDVLTIYQGNAHSAIVRGAEVFRPAIIANAVTVIVAHNHPSGDPSPSAEDIELTRQLAASGRMLGIEVADHIVIGAGGRFTSIREHHSDAWKAR